MGQLSNIRVLLGWITTKTACKPCLEKGRNAIDHNLDPDYDQDDQDNNIRARLNPNPNPSVDPASNAASLVNDLAPLFVPFGTQTHNITVEGHNVPNKQLSYVFWVKLLI